MLTPAPSFVTHLAEEAGLRGCHVLFHVGRQSAAGRRPQRHAICWKLHIRQSRSSHSDFPPDTAGEGRRASFHVIHLADGFLPLSDSTTLLPVVSWLLLAVRPIKWIPCWCRRIPAKGCLDSDNSAVSAPRIERRIAEGGGDSQSSERGEESIEDQSHSRKIGWKMSRCGTPALTPLIPVFKQRPRKQVIDLSNKSVPASHCKRKSFLALEFDHTGHMSIRSAFTGQRNRMAS